jgi:hypothetical protein
MKCAIGWIGGSAAPARADQMTLQDLLNGGTLMVGGVMFSDFSNFSSSAIGALAVDPSQVWVVPTIEGGKFGFTLQGNGQFVAGSDQSLSAHFEFKVTSPRGEKFAMAGLQLTASAHDSSGSSGHVLGTLDNNLPGLSVRTTNPFNNSQSNFPDPLDRIHVQIDIELNGGAGPEALASLDGLEFTIGGLRPTPEPGTLTLLGIGAVGLVGYGWRRRKVRL